MWWKWWDGLNPKWRERVNGRPKIAGSVDWSCLVKPGQNGFLTVVMSLIALLDAAPLEEWTDAVADVSWAFAQVVEHLKRYVLIVCNTLLSLTRPSIAHLPLTTRGRPPPPRSARRPPVAPSLLSAAACAEHCCPCPFVRLSVRPSVRPSVRRPKSLLSVCSSCPFVREFVVSVRLSCPAKSCKRHRTWWVEAPSPFACPSMYNK